MGGRINISLSGKNVGGKTSIGSRIFGTLFFFVFFAAGCFFLVMTTREAWKGAKTRLWKQADCTILESRVRDGVKNEERHVFEVRYAYQWQGREYISGQYRLGYRGHDAYHDAQRLLVRFPPERAAACRVNPATPDQAVLDHASIAIFFFIIIPVIFIIIGGIGMFAMWSRHADPKERKAITAGKPNTPEAKSRAERRARGGLVFLFGIFLLIGLVGTYFLLLRPLLRVQAARSWVETPCTVIDSDVRSHDSDDGMTYSVYVFYRYEYAGKTYQSERYHFMGGSSSGRDGKARVVRQYPRGKKTVCFVDPDAPEEAVLNRGFTPDMLFGLIPLLFGVIGLFGLRYAFSKKPARERRPGSPAGRTPSTRSASALAARQSAPGPVELPMKNSPLAQFIGMLFFALFWNGIVSVFLFQLIKEYRQGNFPVGMTLFMTPFVLIGLGLVFGVIYMTLKLFNPRPVLTLSNAPLALGGRATLTWRMHGSAERITRLRIYLQGQERATYQRGTTTTTDKSDFHRSVLHDATQRNQFHRGQIDLEIPAHTMHSFKSPNNEIVWTLRVHGEIQRWADLDQSFPIQIDPAPADGA